MQEVQGQFTSTFQPDQALKNLFDGYPICWSDLGSRCIGVGSVRQKVERPCPALPMELRRILPPPTHTHPNYLQLFSKATISHFPLILPSVQPVHKTLFQYGCIPLYSMNHMEIFFKQNGPFGSQTCTLQWARGGWVFSGNNIDVTVKIIG